MNTLTLSVKNEPQTASKDQTAIPAVPEPTVQLVDGPKLLELVFPADCRPTLRWLRERQKKREIPFVKLGRLVFFNPAQVKEALDQRQIATRN